MKLKKAALYISACLCIISAEKINLGSASSFYERIEESSIQRSKAFDFPVSRSESIRTTINDYYNEEGQLSMSGHVEGVDSSICMIKGSVDSLYGWVVDYAMSRAFEYTTKGGITSVEQVAIEHVIPVCHIQTEDGSCHNVPVEECPHMQRAMHSHIGEYDGSNVNTLQSKPGASKVFYMDITRVMSGDQPKNFSKEEMWITWQCVAASLSMFDVNVTTDATVYNSYPVTSSGIARFIDEDGRSNAPVNSFGSTNYSKNYRNIEKGYGLGRTAAHEIGHQLGLYHDGGAGDGEYFNGIATYKWTPLMGNYWPGTRWGAEALYQWSLGEYTGASNTTQDDIKLIARHLPLLPDDQTGVVPLVLTGQNVEPELNEGYINSRTDSDEFSFTIGSGGGSVDLFIGRLEAMYCGMLDVTAEIKDKSGTVVVSDNPIAKRSASLSSSLEAGSYTLVVSGGAEGTPQNGFSNYGSMGYFSISGTISGAVGDTAIYIATPTAGAVFEKGDVCTIKWSDNIDEKISITLMENGGPILQIEETESDGEYEWKIPSSLNSSEKYALVLTSVSNSSVSDTSGLFTIKDEFLIDEFPYVEKFNDLDTAKQLLSEGWQQSDNDEFDWTLWSGPTPSKAGQTPNVTGPDGDYPNGAGNYMYVEASDPNNPGKKAALVTPKFQLPSSEMELSFYCHMFSDSAHMGTLSLEVQSGDNIKKELISFSADSGDQWFPVYVDLSDFKGEKVRFTFNAKTGESWASDICIDDLSVYHATSLLAQDVLAHKMPKIMQKGHTLTLLLNRKSLDEKVNIRILNTKGQVLSELYDGICSKLEHQFTIKELSSGFYLFRIQQGNTTHTLPVIKE